MYVRSGARIILPHVSHSSSLIPTVLWGNPPYWIGDGICDFGAGYDATDECGWDGGDCEEDPIEIIPIPIPIETNEPIDKFPSAEIEKPIGWSQEMLAIGETKSWIERYYVGMFIEENDLKMKSVKRWVLNHVGCQHTMVV